MRRSFVCLSIALFSVMLVAAAAVPPIPQCKCNMIIMCDEYGLQFFFCEDVCSDGRDCDFHNFWGIYGDSWQCRCGGQGGSLDTFCKCLVNSVYYSYSSGTWMASCQSYGCASSCTKTLFTAPWTPAYVCECP